MRTVRTHVIRVRTHVRIVYKYVSTHVCAYARVRMTHVRTHVRMHVRTCVRTCVSTFQKNEGEK